MKDFLIIFVDLCSISSFSTLIFLQEAGEQLKIFWKMKNKLSKKVLALIQISTFVSLQNSKTWYSHTPTVMALSMPGWSRCAHSGLLNQGSAVWTLSLATINEAEALWGLLQIRLQLYNQTSNGLLYYLHIFITALGTSNLQNWGRSELRNCRIDTH